MSNDITRDVRIIISLFSYRSPSSAPRLYSSIIRITGWQTAALRADSYMTAIIMARQFSKRVYKMEVRPDSVIAWMESLPAVQRSEF